MENPIEKLSLEELTALAVKGTRKSSADQKVERDFRKMVDDMGDRPPEVSQTDLVEKMKTGEDRGNTVDSFRKRPKVKTLSGRRNIEEIELPKDLGLPGFRPKLSFDEATIAHVPDSENK
ncbi:MAG TPA: hypothetical protein PLV72_01035 [Candidatus Magasanikbacteria bacterium]|nr:hypothetical protein [Candidatus Magasanikbacteria bacterium]